ncbi:MAG: PH domain-containing protein [Candidatus Thorarchaeota archaeon]|jgi:membrane protein YdbS with pleckstrin-like domain
MSGRYESTVIKPPMEQISSGKVFRPSMRFLYKNWFGSIMGGVILYSMAMTVWIGMTYIIFVLDDGNSVNWFWNSYIGTWFPLGNLILVVVLSIIFLPMLIIYPIYIRTFEYSVISKSGDTMPEIYVQKGIVTRTKKHVPFRTITNIASRAGPLDRLFGIGNIEIHTAGQSGGSQYSQGGPEEKLEGIVFYEEVRDFVLNELRKFRTPYVTGTEIPSPDDFLAPSSDSIDDEILMVLQDIRDILKDREDR